MTWQQRQETLYLDRLRERWNEDGTRKLNVNAFDVDGTPITSGGWYEWANVTPPTVTRLTKWHTNVCNQ